MPVARMNESIVYPPQSKGPGQMSQKLFLTPRPAVFNLCLLPVVSPAHAWMKPPPLSTGPETPHSTSLDELASSGFICLFLNKQQQQREAHAANCNRTAVGERLSSFTSQKQKKTKEALEGEEAAVRLFDCRKRQQSLCICHFREEGRSITLRFVLYVFEQLTWQRLHKHRQLNFSSNFIFQAYYTRNGQLKK